MAKKEYSIEVSYPSNFWTIPFDDAMRKAVGNESDGSGCGMGIRDIQWIFKVKTTATAAFEKLRKHLAKKGFKFSKTGNVRGKSVYLTLSEVDKKTYDSEVIETA